MAKKSIKKRVKRPKKVEKSSIGVPKGEVLMLFVLFASFAAIAISKCNKTRDVSPIIEQIVTDSIEQDTLVFIETSLTDTKKVLDTSKLIIPLKESKTSLFVVLDSLKLRKGPSLDSTTVQYIRLNEKVFFMNEVSSFTQRINLENEIFDEPWIKIKTKKGNIGWSYGAGLNYYQQINDKK